MINPTVAHLHQVLWMSCSMIYLTCIKLSVILRLARNYAITRLVILMKMIYRSDVRKIYADASYDHHFTAYHMQGEKHLSLRPEQSTLQPYKPSGPLRQACKQTLSFHTEQFTNMKCCAMCYEHDKKKFVAHLHRVLWMSFSMIYLTCIKLSVILRLARNYAITRLVILMKMIYRSNMSKIYADASYNHHFTAYHMQG